MGMQVIGELADRYAVRASTGGPTTVPKARYLDEQYAALERKRLWPVVWQMAGIQSDIAEPGQWIEYRIADQSYVVLRDVNGELRAFHNVCPHRGFKICDGAGVADDGFLRCGYHGWRYDLDGAVREITSQKGFGSIDREQFGLRPVQVGTWAQMIFINPSLSAGPLEDFLDPLPASLAHFGLGDRTCSFRCTVTMAGNWKVTVDAFNEVYHLQGLHPTLMPFMDDVHTTYRVFERGHSMMQIPLGVASPRLGAMDDAAVIDGMHAGYASMFGERRPQRDETPREYAVERVRARCAQADVDISHLRDDEVIDDFHYLVFPNIVLNVHAEMHTVFRARPGMTPNKSSFDFFLFHRIGEGPPKGPADHIEFPEGARVTEVLDQDLDGIARVHAGLQSAGIDAVSFADFECRLAAMHEELDRYLLADDGR